MALLCAEAAILRAASDFSQVDAAEVYAADVDSIIHPVSAEYMIETMARADRDGAALVVFTLRTPGGLVESTRNIVTHMLAAKTPVVIFIAPAGARAASAGFLIAIAADVAAMAPGTHIGAAHPVAGNGEKMDETMAKKATADVAAYARTLATQRHRNVSLAEEAVNNSRAFTDEEALHATPPLIDLVASDIPDLLRKLDGRTVMRFDGTSVVLSTAGAQTKPIAMTRRQRVLSAIAHPNVAYILLSLGMLGLTIELWTPGAVLPGVAGGLSLLLAFFALQILPVNYAGLLLIGFGVLLLVLEAQGHQLRAAHRRRTGELPLWLDDSDGLGRARTARQSSARVADRACRGRYRRHAGPAGRGVPEAAGRHGRRRHDRRDGTCADLDRARRDRSGRDTRRNLDREVAGSDRRRRRDRRGEGGWTDADRPQGLSACE